jgi:GNAT superfamily N-acetyltransferase
MITIRPFEPADAEYEAFVALQLAVWPEYRDTVDEWKHRDRTRDASVFFERYVVERQGELVASGLCCEPWWSLKPGKYYVNVDVHPEHRRQGIGTSLYDYLVDRLSEYKPTKLVSHTQEDRADGIRFLEKRGFQQVMRYPVSHLDVQGFDPKRYASKLARVEESGIDILPLSKVAEADGGWKRKLWDLEWELVQDVPSPDPLTRQSFELFQERVLGYPGFDADAWFIALADDQWVGMSNLWIPQGDREKLYTGLTGVVRSHRRRGVATAMKVRGIEFARQWSARIIETDNEENNPMFFLNLDLGFEPQPAMLDFEKEIKKG